MVCKYSYAENAAVFIGITDRNNSILEYEKYIHQTFYPNIIHPYSRFRVYWELYFAIHIILRLTIICFIWAVLYHGNVVYQIIIMAFQAINVVEIILMFFTGYVEYSTDVVVLEPKKIAVRYLTKFFIFDFIASIPMDYLFYHLEKDIPDINFSNGCWFYSPSSFLCSLARLSIFILYLTNLTRIFLWDRLVMGMVIICVVMYLIVLFSANFYLCNMENVNQNPTYENLGFSVPLSKYDRFSSYFDTLLLIILDCLFFAINFPIESDLIKSVVLNLTFIGSAFFTAYFINYVVMRMKNQEKFLDVETQVRTFVTTKQFSSSLRNKTILYFHVLLEKRYTKDDEIFNYIPDTYKGDIFYHLCLPLLKNFYCFEDLPTFVLRRLAESLNYQLYLPNELVMSQEEPVLRMYFIQSGTVALYTSRGIELYHFEAGSNFNGRNFISGELVNTNYAISVEVTELYRLNHDDFMEIMSVFPKSFQKINEKQVDNRKDSSYLME